MTAKIYAYLGMNQASIDIPVSANGSVHVEFTGGNVNSKVGFRLATTNVILDAGMQEVIEGSPLFGKKIIIFQTTEIEDPKAPKEDKEVELTEYPDVVDFTGAVAVLKANYQAKASQLRSVAAVANFARSVGASFPNWTI